DEIQNKTERFQAATAATLRALGLAPTHEVVFGGLYNSGPEQTEFPLVADENILRALSDLQAAHLRFGSPGVKISDNAAKNEFFRFLGEAREAACLSQDFSGVRHNILQFWLNHPEIDFRHLTEGDPPNTELNHILQECRLGLLGQTPQHPM